MYNDSYYSRRGRTIERKKVDSGQVINPRLVPIYYNYFKDNGLFPSAPAPPVHVDDGTCIAVDYSPAQSYSFPEVKTSLTDALSTLLFNLSIDVDIAKVDHINLSFYVTSSAPSLTGNVLLFSDSSNSYLVTVGDQLNSGENYYDTYNLTFSRDYSSSDTVFCLDCTRSYDSSNMNALITPSQKLTRVMQISNGDVYIARIVVAALTE